MLLYVIPHEAPSHILAAPLSTHMRLQRLPNCRGPKTCRTIVRSFLRKQGIWPVTHFRWKPGGAPHGPRVFVLSDLHTDYVENLAWVKRLSSAKHGKDILLVAGDVAETYKRFVHTMSLLKDRFQSVFYVPGNHDLWCRWEGEKYLADMPISINLLCHHLDSQVDACRVVWSRVQMLGRGSGLVAWSIPPSGVWSSQVDSIEKLDALLDACSKLGVETNPRVVDGLGIIPLFSWYHESFDKEKDIKGIRMPSLEMVCKDFHACKWPLGLSRRDSSLALYFDTMNERNHDIINEIQRSSHQIITFSHFLPRPELCPEKRMLFYPNLPKIVGSDYLEARLRSIHGTGGGPSACHVFGHTHFCWDAMLDGIRYVQAPLAYPRERKRRMNFGGEWLPFCIYYDGQLGDKLSHCFWSDYYSINKRDPENVELAPWVAKYYAR